MFELQRGWPSDQGLPRTGLGLSQTSHLDVIICFTHSHSLKRPVYMELYMVIMELLSKNRNQPQYITSFLWKNMLQLTTEHGDIKCTSRDCLYLIIPTSASNTALELPSHFILFHCPFSEMTLKYPQSYCIFQYMSWYNCALSLFWKCHNEVTALKSYCCPGQCVSVVGALSCALKGPGFGPQSGHVWEEIFEVCHTSISLSLSLPRINKKMSLGKD